MKKKEMGVIAIVITIGLLIALVIHSSWIRMDKINNNGMLFQLEDEAVALSDAEVFHKELPTEGIQIPGYANMTFTQNETAQNMLLYNPEGNNCLFQYHIKLDGQIIYDSQYIEPGTGIEQIELTRGLEAGEYQLEIQIDTYQIDTHEAMNNAIVYADLKVL